MIQFEVLIAIIIFAFVSSITPGPNNIMLLASGTNYGFKRTIPHLFGIFIGFSFLLTSDIVLMATSLIDELCVFDADISFELSMPA